MLQLSSLGGLSVRLDGVNITGAITQRRQLALLALLAVARKEGMSRDKLVALLWPEKDAARARHILNQLIYFQRRHAGQAGLFLGRKTLRLNPATVTADIWEFEDAISNGRPSEAVPLYRGRFLDGFFLSDAAEFESWVERQRQRLARQCAEILENLAQVASRSGDPSGAVRWRQRAQEMDPLDARAAVALAEALVASGDRPAAMRALQWHQERVRKDLEVDPDPAVQELAARLGAARPPSGS